MKVLFIVPLNESFEEIVGGAKKDWIVPLNPKRTIKRISCCYPGGVLAIGAYVTKHLPTVEVRILDFNVALNQIAERRTEGFAGYTREDFYGDALATLADFAPDVVGVSSLFCDNYRDLKSLAAFLRGAFPDALLVAGGHLVTAIYRQIFAEGMAFDAIAYAEGEIPFLELCHAWEAGRSAAHLATSPLWVTPEKARPDSGFTPARYFIDNLDEIPPYDLRTLVFPDAYFHSSENLFTVAPSQPCREMYIFTTRGCPHHCVFCASHNVHGRKIRTHSVERIKEDILHYHREFGVNRFNFSDDHFFARKSRAIELLDFVVANGLEVDVMGAAFFSVDAEIAATLRRVGIRQLNITIESGNEDTLMNIIHKPANLKRAEAAVECLHREGITVISNVLIGFPGETKDAIDKGLDYLLGTNIDWFLCLIASPLPGSELHAICTEGGYLTGDAMNMNQRTRGRCVICTPDFTPEYIEKKVYEMNLRLNFVNNYGMRSGDYENALRLFERVITVAISTHAFAYYYAARCCEKLGLPEKYRAHKAKYEEMLAIYPFWREWSAFFALPPLP